MKEENKQQFYLKLDQNFFNKNDIICSFSNHKFVVIETPHKKWWKTLFQWISFGLYKAPYQYKIKEL